MMPSITKGEAVLDGPNVQGHVPGLLRRRSAFADPMFQECERLATYTDWPVSFLTPQAMARAGFFFTHIRDIVRCPFCDVEVMSWEEGDDPMEDHKKWKPTCRFILNIPGNGNIPLASDSSIPAPQRNCGYDTCGPYEIRGMDVPSQPRLGNEISSSVLNFKAPSFPQYATIEARMESFNYWPVSLKIKPNVLSEAGFYYTGKGDQTICYYCGGGLKDWEDNDDPWTEHAKWFSVCSYVLLKKGEDFVNKAKQSVMQSKSSQDSSKTQMEMKIEKVPNVVASADVNAASTSSESTDRDAMLCTLCYNNGLEVVFLPCGHLMSCVDCSLKLTKCGICRQEIKNVVRTYLP